MALVTAKEILTPRPRGWAVGAFNVHNLEDTQAVVWAAEKLQTPVIIQVSENALNYAGAPYISRIVQVAAGQAAVPVALQLDHAKSFEVALQCMRLGFTSVMIDGSHLPFAENVALTKKVVEAAKDFGVSVEGELGMVGGKEGDPLDSQDYLTDPEQALEFVHTTGIDLFAPAIGTQHGRYPGEPNIDYERLERIRDLVPIPLALHGGSDLPTEVIIRLIDCGVEKINVGTDLKIAITSGLREFLQAHPSEHEPRRVFAAARARAQEVVMEKMRLLGMVGKAQVV